MTDISILLLRIVISIIFISSGWKHFTNPQERAKSITMPVWFTFLLGIAEVAAGLSVLTGIFIKVGALILMVDMIGAIYKKIFEWKTGFWGEKNSGWYYDLLYFSVNFVIFATNGGKFVLIQ